MSERPKILAFAGSTRTDSYNKRLVKIAAQGAEAAGAAVQVVDLRDFPMPIFDEDWEREHGAPETAKTLKALMASHHGLLIASPEYNSSISAVLKNTLDWVSRTAPDEPPMIAFRGKTATLMSASPGGLGGLRGLVHLRAILSNMGVIVLPEQVAVAAAYDKFQDAGALKDPKQHAAIEDLGKRLATFLAVFHG